MTNIIESRVVENYKDEENITKKICRDFLDKPIGTCIFYKFENKNIATRKLMNLTSYSKRYKIKLSRKFSKKEDGFFFVRIG